MHQNTRTLTIVFGICRQSPENAIYIYIYITVLFYVPYFLSIQMLPEHRESVRKIQISVKNKTVTKTKIKTEAEKIKVVAFSVIAFICTYVLI